MAETEKETKKKNVTPKKKDAEKENKTEAQEKKTTKFVTCVVQKKFLDVQQNRTFRPKEIWEGTLERFQEISKNLPNFLEIVKGENKEL